MNMQEEQELEYDDGPYKALVAKLIMLQAEDPAYAMAILCCLGKDTAGNPLTNEDIANLFMDLGEHFFFQPWSRTKVWRLRNTMALEMPEMAELLAPWGDSQE